MRLRNKPWVAQKIAVFPFVYPKESPADETFRGRWREIFNRPNSPLFVELGTGKGDFISKIAQREPENLFIGLEMQETVLYSAAVKVAAAELSNIRLLTFDINRLEDIFSQNEVSGFYINFCDPWPKKRHAKRRLTHHLFLEKYQRILQNGGKLIFKTDNRPLFDFSLEEFREFGLNVNDISYDLHAENHPDNIETEYERKFSGFGEKIHRCIVSFP